MNKFSFIESEMKNREIMHQKRYLVPVRPINGMEVNIKGRTMINFCSNDYLGLSKHPMLKERAKEFMDRYGSGSTGSRLICGTYDFFQPIEDKLADLKGSESTLILNSGFQANLSILSSLADRQTLILSDELNHNSIVQGILLSRCKTLKYRHNDLRHLQQLLEDTEHNAFSRTIIITESVFSVDGDQSDIDALVELAERYQSLLIVDEAHATGILGNHGMGLTCGKSVDVVIGTFSKACGSFGAYVACSRKLRDYFINRCYGFIYSTALPPAVAGSIDAALDLIPSMEKEREYLYGISNHLRLCLKKLKLNTGPSTTQIIPVILGEEQKTLALSKLLEKNGIFAVAIRPPTVPQDQARIRLSLSSLHSEEQIEHLIGVFRNCENR